MHKIIEDDIFNLQNNFDSSFFHNKKILLTGASGLLGTYFLAYFKLISNQVKINVTGIVNSNINSNTLYHSNFSECQLLEIDLTENFTSSTLSKYDIIIHAAGYGQPGKFLDNQIKTIQVNTSSLIKLFDLLNENGTFLFISTSEVYTGLVDIPFNEGQIGTNNTDHPRACYIESKRCGETICFAKRKTGINAISARLALAYGPGTKINDHRVLNNFIQKALINKSILLQDNGEAERVYCYISDAIEILINIIIAGKNPLYNVGGKSHTTILNLANIIGNHLNVPVLLPEKVNILYGSPQCVSLDMSLVEKEFDKTVFTNLNDGLSKTIQWQKYIYNI